VPPERNDYELRFYVPEELYGMVRLLAERDDRSMADYLRRAVRAHVNQECRHVSREIVPLEGTASEAGGT